MNPKQLQRRRILRSFSDWNESDHPRDADGKFGSGGGGNAQGDSAESSTFTDEDRDTGKFYIGVDEIRKLGGNQEWNENASPLYENERLPVIVIEHEDDYELLDGHNRVSGLINGGADGVTAILVSEKDLESRAGGDDEEWVESMWEKYAPHLSYHSGH